MMSNAIASASTLNIPLARKVLEHLHAHPEEHQQGNFSQQTPCGTTACIAGTAVLMDADTTVNYRLSDGFIDCQVEVNGTQVDIEHRAMALLGLDADDAMELFYEFNEAKALVRLGQIITAAEAAQT